VTDGCRYAAAGLGMTAWMHARLRIETAAHAAAVREQLTGLERRFRAGTDPASSQHLAREIIRLRMALTSYMLRVQMREAHDHQIG
jgi:hypothetical protein